MLTEIEAFTKSLKRATKCAEKDYDIQFGENPT
jgi:hypothetical protein